MKLFEQSVAFFQLRTQRRQQKKRHETNHHVESIERPTVNGMYTVYIIYKQHQFHYLHVCLFFYQVLIKMPHPHSLLYSH